MKHENPAIKSRKGREIRLAQYISENRTGNRADKGDGEGTKIAFCLSAKGQRNFYEVADPSRVSEREHGHTAQGFAKTEFLRTSAPAKLISLQHHNCHVDCLTRVMDGWFQFY